MISDITVEATVRTSTGSAESRRLRRQGRIPATIYGDKKDPISVSVDAKQITLILRSDTGHNTVFKLKPSGFDETIVMIKDWQIDPVKSKLMHADFYRISLTEKQRISVPVELKGEPTGVKFGHGILEHNMREIEVECLPMDIPDSFEVDVSGLNLGGHILVKDLKVADNVRIIDSPDMIVASVLAPRVEEEPVAAAEVAEPEVIKKGKIEEQ